jgi:hypothetical protein
MFQPNWPSSGVYSGKDTAAHCNAGVTFDRIRLKLNLVARVFFFFLQCMMCYVRAFSIYVPSVIVYI